MTTRETGQGRIGSGAVRVLAVPVVIFLVVIYLKLGDFILFLIPIGALAAVLLTRRQRAAYPPGWSSLVVVVAYGAATALVWFAANQNREERRELKWEVLEVPGQAEPEVRLYLDGTHYLYLHSAQLGQYLRSRSTDTVPVELPVTRTLGCFQALGDPRIEGWGLVPRSSYASGPGAGPWEEHWWCP